MVQILRQNQQPRRSVEGRGLVILAILSAAVLAGCSSKFDSLISANVAAQQEHHATAMKMPPAVTPVADFQSEPNQVLIDNFTFSPAMLTVPVGAKVTWINHDDVPHTATSSVKPRVFDSKTLDTDDQFSYVFTAPGAYKYFCAVHPHMTGEIVVK